MFRQQRHLHIFQRLAAAAVFCSQCPKYAAARQKLLSLQIIFSQNDSGLPDDLFLFAGRSRILLPRIKRVIFPLRFFSQRQRFPSVRNFRIDGKFFPHVSFRRLYQHRQMQRILSVYPVLSQSDFAFVQVYAVCGRLYLLLVIFEIKGTVFFPFKGHADQKRSALHRRVCPKGNDKAHDIFFHRRRITFCKRRVHAFVFFIRVNPNQPFRPHRYRRQKK